MNEFLKFMGLRGPRDAWPKLVVRWYALIVSITGFAFASNLLVSHRAQHQLCTFDRNELGPRGDHGQWWWDIYKCADGSERRALVAGPRG